MKLLVLLPRFQYPLDKGDKLRAYHQLRYLARHHEVCLFCLSDEDVSAASYAAVQPLCQGGLHVQRLRRPGIARNMVLASLRGLPLQVGYFYDAAAQRRLNALIREFRPDHVYCQLIRMAQYVRGYAGQLPMTLDYMDVFSTGMLRRAEQCRWAEQRLFRHEGRRLQAYEAAAFDWFQRHTIISDQDRQLIEHPRRQQIHIVRNGIDTDFFRPRPRRKNARPAVLRQHELPSQRGCRRVSGPGNPAAGAPHAPSGAAAGGWHLAGAAGAGPGFGSRYD